MTSTWTTRPPQHRFDGSDATRAIRAQRQAELEANPDGKYWREKADRYAAKCCDLMGTGHYQRFMAAYTDATFEAHTWKDQAEAYVRLCGALEGWHKDVDTLRKAFGWPAEVTQ